MLADDILELIKVFADIPSNKSFDELFMPNIYSSLQAFGHALDTKNDAEISKFLDAGVLKSLMNIVSTHALNQSTKSPQDLKKYHELIQLIIGFRQKSDDVYVCLYAYRTLAALFKAGDDDLSKKFAVQVLSLLREDLKVP